MFSLFLHPFRLVILLCLPWTRPARSLRTDLTASQTFAVDQLCLLVSMLDTHSCICSSLLATQPGQLISLIRWCCCTLHLPSFGAAALVFPTPHHS
jgi:hypothetical protein